MLESQNRDPDNDIGQVGERLLIWRPIIFHFSILICPTSKAVDYLQNRANSCCETKAEYINAVAHRESYLRRGVQAQTGVGSGQLDMSRQGQFSGELLA